jgi:hypothetical protein
MFRTGSKGKSVAQGMEVLRFHGLIAGWEFNMADKVWRITLIETENRRPVETVGNVTEADAYVNGALAMFRAIRDGFVNVP